MLRMCLSEGARQGCVFVGVYRYMRVHIKGVCCGAERCTYYE